MYEQLRKTGGNQMGKRLLQRLSVRISVVASTYERNFYVTYIYKYLAAISLVAFVNPQRSID